MYVHTHWVIYSDTGSIKEIRSKTHKVTSTVASIGVVPGIDGKASGKSKLPAKIQCSPYQGRMEIRTHSGQVCLGKVG